MTLQIDPANPAQVTDAMVEAAVRAIADMVVLAECDAPEIARAAITAAIGAGRSSEPEFETAPDNGTPAEVLAYVLECVRRWVPEARIIGNARAGDIERALAAIGAGGQAVAQFLATEDGEFNGNDTVANIVPDGCSGKAIVFDPGTLHVNKDGSGYIVVAEDEWQLEDDRCEGVDGPEGSVHWITRLEASEMQALRDFLNDVEYPRVHPPHPADERVVEALREAGCTTEDGTYVHAPMKEVVAALSGSGVAHPVQPGWRDGLLDKLAEHKNFELSWGAHPDDDTEACWQVHRVNGGRNDREWTLIGVGNTPHEALYAALPVAPQPKGE